MTALVKDEKRRLIPRWRYFRDIPNSCELAGDPSKSNTFSPEQQHLTEKLNNWQSNPGIATAAEVVSSAVVMGQQEKATDCAQYINDHEEQTLPSVVVIAKHVLRHTELNEQTDKVCNISSLHSDLNVNAKAVIQTARSAIRRNPRNIIARMDMSRAHAILGQNEKAVYEMGIALKLHPEHRYVLRSASRLFIHVGDPEEAHSVIARSARTIHDPWLMATELSTASIAERTPKNRNNARKLLARQHLPESHLTELYSALGTFEYFDGHLKHARRNMRSGLHDPTENVVAQARWLQAKNLTVDIPETAWDIPLSYEAHCWKMLQDKDWNGAAEQCKKWICDEPFSSRPARVGSCLGIGIISNIPYAEECARIGLMSDPNDHTLLNNFAVIQAYQGKLEEAVKTFNQITEPLSYGLSNYVYLATAGLISFRSGLLEQGHQLYEQAENMAPKIAKPLVLIYWAKEELLAGTQDSKQIQERAKKARDTCNDHYIQKMHDELLKPKQNIDVNQIRFDAPNTIILPSKLK